METLSQLIKQGRVPYCHIRDEPRFEHRGIMIDTARHYLSMETIQQLIETMPMSKLNILHWHLIDDEAFTVEVSSHLELSKYGAYSAEETYSLEDIKAIIALADKNGIRIIPEVDTPARMRSWVQSPTWKAKNLTINCNATEGLPKYCHQLDPSKGEGLQLVQDVVRELDEVFRTSPYFHLGGSQINYGCWDSKANIKNTFMKLHNIKDYDGLVEYLRFEVKQALPASRKVIYWVDQAQTYPTSENDVLQFKGSFVSDLPKGTPLVTQ
jgi:hexosaminidase